MVDGKKVEAKCVDNTLRLLSARRSSVTPTLSVSEGSLLARQIDDIIRNLEFRLQISPPDFVVSF